jgi:hypothetical protein
MSDCSRTAPPRGNTAGINLYESRSCLVGGSSADSLQRNVISGNGTGIILQNLAFGNTICGNIIGLNPAMNSAVANNNGSIWLRGLTAIISACRRSITAT